MTTLHILENRREICSQQRPPTAARWVTYHTIFYLIILLQLHNLWDKRKIISIIIYISWSYSYPHNPYDNIDRQ